MREGDVDGWELRNDVDVWDDVTALHVRFTSMYVCMYVMRPKPRADGEVLRRAQAS